MPGTFVPKKKNELYCKLIGERIVKRSGSEQFSLHARIWENPERLRRR